MDFDTNTPPREIFVYACQRIAEPFAPLGFKYRKSKNDLCKTEGDFTYTISFQPSIKAGSTAFTAHVAVSSKVLAKWCSEHYQKKDDGLIFMESLARLTKRDNEWPRYAIATHTERERVIAELTAVIQDFALPFFSRFANPEELAREVANKGFLPHRKGPEWDKARREDFVRCYGGDRGGEGGAAR